MNKTTIKSIVLGTLVGASVLSTHAYNVQIWSPVQYVKQLFVTPNGELDPAKATILMDGVTGKFTAKIVNAKQINLNGHTVATQDYTNSKASTILSSAQSYARSKANSALSSAQSYARSKANSALSSAQSYARSKANSALSSAQSYARSKVNSALSSAMAYTDRTSSRSAWKIVSSCNSSSVGMPNSLGRICQRTVIRVTDRSPCINQKRDGVERFSGNRTRCLNGHVRGNDGNGWRIRKTVGMTTVYGNYTFR